MPEEIYPSSYICDCGAKSHHFENTIREMEKNSHNRRQVLMADDIEHTIIFQHGKFVAMYCPKTHEEIPANKQ